MNTKSLRRAAAAFASAALLSLGLGVTAMSATAAGIAAVANPSNIDPAATVTLTVHKYEGPASTCTTDGTDVSACVDAAGKAKLPGAKFTATQVLYNGSPIDLTTNAGWTAATNFLTGANKWNGSTTLPAGYTLGTVSGPITTDANGIANFTTLTKTLYIVTETAPPPGTTGSTYTGGAPFAVTLPMASSDGSSWLYAVHAFPKNIKATITKEVTDSGTAGADSGTTASNTIKYLVKTSIDRGYITSTEAATQTGTPLQYYAVHDTFDPRLTPSAAVVVQLVDATTTTTLAVTTDYTVTVTGQKVDVVFTQTGLDKLVLAKRNDPSAHVETTFPTTLTTANCVTTPATGQVTCPTGGTTGDIMNTATFTPNQSPGVDSNGNPVTHPETPSNTVESFYANLKLTKVNNVTANNGLEGATFDLYQINSRTCDASIIAAASSVRIATGVKTAADGTITWNSLKTSTWTNGLVTSANHNYCVVETAPPAGYVLPAAPYTYVFLPDSSPGVTIGVTISNAEVPPNQLPLTGGAGVAAVSGLGLLLVGGGLGYYVVSSRRRREEQEG